MRNGTALIYPCCPEAYTGIAELTITKSLSLRLRKLVIASSSLRWRYLWLECKTIHFTFSHALHLLPLLQYPTNAIKRPHTALETCYLIAIIFIPSLKFSYTIYCNLKLHSSTLSLCLSILNSKTFFLRLEVRMRFKAYSKLSLKFMVKYL